MNFAIDQVPAFYRPYFAYLDGSSLIDLLHKSRDRFTYLLSTFSEEKGRYAYQEGKWTIKDIIQHLIDSERVFTYRALRFARGDSTPLDGFEQNEYALEASANDRLMKDLIAEFVAVRASTIQLFESLDEKALTRIGTASGVEFGVEMLGFLVSGHVLHHLNVINERYL